MNTLILHTSLNRKKNLLINRSLEKQDSFKLACEVLIQHYTFNSKFDEMKKYQYLLEKLSKEDVIHKGIFEHVHNIILGLIDIENIRFAEKLARRLHSVSLESKDYIKQKDAQVSQWCEDMARKFESIGLKDSAEIYHEKSRIYKE